MYYCLVLFLLFLGPCLFWGLLVFHPKTHQLHDEYLLWGVECIGIITHCCITVHRSGLLRLETHRTYQIRFAYKAPGTDTVYIKNYVTVEEQQSERRPLLVVVLPRQPESGVPKFLLSHHRPGTVKQTAMYLLSIGWSLFSIYLFALLFALALNCENGTCFVTPMCFVLSTIFVMSFGFLFAWLEHQQGERCSVPGRVWKRQHLTTSTLPATTTTTTPRALYERLNDREIPMAEAGTVLNADEETLALAAADAGVITAYPVHDNEKSPSNGKEEIPPASAIEIV